MHPRSTDDAQRSYEREKRIKTSLLNGRLAIDHIAYYAKAWRRYTLHSYAPKVAAAQSR
jgi:hypothetical protein